MQRSQIEFQSACFYISTTLHVGHNLLVFSIDGMPIV